MILPAVRNECDDRARLAVCGKVCIGTTHPYRKVRPSMSRPRLNLLLAPTARQSLKDAYVSHWNNPMCQFELIWHNSPL